MSKTIVSLMNVDKLYGENHVVKNMNMNIAEGEFLTLLGPSGCGKTTTLRMISGFEMPSSGTIKVQGERVDKKEPYQRDVNTVFQNYALFPNMNVYDNVAYGLRVKKVPKNEIRERVMEALKMVQLEGFEKRRITQMSVLYQVFCQRRCQSSAIMCKRKNSNSHDVSPMMLFGIL